MKHCDTKTKISDTRETPDGTWRKHKCQVCDAVFTTVEMICETLRQSCGKYDRAEAGLKKPKAARKPAQPKIVKPKQPKIIKPVAVKAVKVKVVKPKQYATPAQDRTAARKRIEEFKELKELEQ